MSFAHRRAEQKGHQGRHGRHDRQTVLTREGES
jgi:hypothetical protein